jgi:universal stress protein A
MKSFKTILVVSRSTRKCIRALRTGISLARKYDARLHILHVIYDPFVFNDWNITLSSFDDELEKEVRLAREELDRLVKAERAEGLDITEWVKYGKPADEIQKIVEDEKVDLILMLAHEEGRIEHFLFGRTNDAIIRRLPATLMLIK